MLFIRIIFPRGVTVPLNIHDWQVLSGSAAAPQFQFRAELAPIEIGEDCCKAATFAVNGAAATPDGRKPQSFTPSTTTSIKTRLKSPALSRAHSIVLE